MASVLPHFQGHAFIWPLGLFVLWVLTRIISRINQERKIRALGGHTAARHSFPVGIPFVSGALKAGRSHADYPFWRNNFTRYGNKNNPWTIENRILGVRIIQTADEENIKAILATQFHDYGKGEQFNKDFHDFLGDSKNMLTTLTTHD